MTSGSPNSAWTCVIGVPWRMPLSQSEQPLSRTRQLRRAITVARVCGRMSRENALAVVEHGIAARPSHREEPFDIPKLNWTYGVGDRPGYILVPEKIVDQIVPQVRAVVDDVRLVDGENRVAREVWAVRDHPVAVHGDQHR